MHYICIIYALYMHYICIIYALYMHYICIIYAHGMSCNKKQISLTGPTNIIFSFTAEEKVKRITCEIEAREAERTTGEIAEHQKICIDLRANIVSLQQVCSNVGQ